MLSRTCFSLKNSPGVLSSWVSQKINFRPNFILIMETSYEAEMAISASKLVNCYQQKNNKYSKTSHSEHLHIVDTSWSDEAIFAGIEPPYSGHLRTVDTFSRSRGVIFAEIEPLYSGHYLGVSREWFEFMVSN